MSERVIYIQMLWAAAEYGGLKVNKDPSKVKNELVGGFGLLRAEVKGVAPSKS